MNRIAVAREFRESDDVLIFDRLADRLAHAEREVLEIEGLKHQLRHTVQAFIIRSRLSTPGQMDVLGGSGPRKALNILNWAANQISRTDSALRRRSSLKRADRRGCINKHYVGHRVF